MKTRVYHRLSFRMRVYLCVSLVVTLAIAVIGILTYRIAVGTTEQNAYRFSQETLNKTSQALDEKLNKVKTSIFSMMLNTDYRRALGLDNSSEYSDYYTRQSTLQSTFVQLKLIEPLIDTVLLSTPQGDYYLISQLRKQGQMFVNSDLHKRFLQSTGVHREIWVEGHDDLFFSDGRAVVSFMTEGVMNDVTKEDYLVVNIKEESLKQYLLQNLNGIEGRIFLVSQDRKEVLRGDPKLFRELIENSKFQEALSGDDGKFDTNLAEQAVNVNYKRLNAVSDWVLFSVIPRSELLKQTDDLKYAILLIIAGCLIACYTITQLLVRLLLKPIKDLQRVMIKVEQNDLSVRYESPWQDEIAQLGYRFNRMLEEVELSFERVMDAEKQKRKSEIKALQAQIDPHFLYNTLNTIYWKSQMKQLDDVQEMVLSLSRLFQLGLNKGREMTTLENELNHVEQYLIIQQQCYENLFEYRIDVAEEIDMKHPILKILLQPLAENAILHGFKDRNEGGIISIKVTREGTHIRMVVEDNGSGMSPEMEGMRPITATSSMKGYALDNIRQRLLLEYGQEAELTMTSTAGIGMTISIIVPVQAD
ncbi:sensor histidine kinase [Paenibacillus contaminans]|uniref:Sensor histidine kinase n=1 Tax=Paenibacillus contaminans TaxID=450362 RepID=A0A329MME8_9BACL|nr:sensor histidine kinase [Paenibacillus contaminans]RAV20792.1 sensor histidine kinase [Paenibacillus contaminans]